MSTANRLFRAAVGVAALTVLAHLALSRTVSAQHAPPKHGTPTIDGPHTQAHQPRHGHHGEIAPGKLTGPFGLSVYGAFQTMMRTQDFSPKVELSTIVRDGATEAVGAASELRGEVTAIDGKLLLTYGAPCSNCGSPREDRATLLAAAKVEAWHPPIDLPENLTGQALDEFIVSRAVQLGLDATKPFPMRMKGTLVDVKMHVIKAFNPQFKGHGSGHAMADQVDIVSASIEGEVVGFYAPPSAQGIITHPGEPFHYHWVDTERTRTAHLDSFGMAKGSKLLIPLK